MATPMDDAAIDPVKQAIINASKRAVKPPKVKNPLLDPDTPPDTFDISVGGSGSSPAGDASLAPSGTGQGTSASSPISSAEAGASVSETPAASNTTPDFLSKSAPSTSNLANVGPSYVNAFSASPSFAPPLSGSDVARFQALDQSLSAMQATVSMAASPSAIENAVVADATPVSMQDVATTTLNNVSQAVQSGDTAVANTPAYAALQDMGAFSSTQTSANTDFASSLTTMPAAQQTAAISALTTLQIALSPIAQKPISMPSFTAQQIATMNAASTQGINGLSFLQPGVDPPPPPATSTTPEQIPQTGLDKAMSYVGMPMGMIQLASLVTRGATKGLSGAIQAIAANPIFAVAGGVTAAVGVFSAFRNIFKYGLNGQTVVPMIMSLGGAALATYTLGMTLFINMTWAAFIPWAAAALAVIIFLAWLFGHKSNTAEKQMQNFDDLTVWSSKQVLTLASTAAFMAMGFNIDNPGNVGNAAVNVPTIKLQQALSHNLANSDGSAYSGAIPYGVPLVLKGQGAGGGDRVVIISQGQYQGGQGMDTVSTYDLSKNMAFTKPTRADGAYVAFFGPDGKVNQAAVSAVNSQRALLQALPTMAAKNQSNAAALVGTLDKQGVTPVATGSGSQ